MLYLISRHLMKYVCKSYSPNFKSFFDFFTNLFANFFLDDNTFPLRSLTPYLFNITSLKLSHILMQTLKIAKSVISLNFSQARHKLSNDELSKFLKFPAFPVKMTILILSVIICYKACNFISTKSI